jgi:hypothetical protein
VPGRLPDAYRALRVAHTWAAQDLRRPGVRGLVADMMVRDRRGALPELRRFAEQLGVCV